MPNLMATKFKTPSFSTGITNRYNSRRHFREPFITSTLSRIASWKCLTLYGPPPSYKGSKHYNNPTRFYPKKVVSSTNFGGKCWCWWILMLRPTFLKCFNALLCSSNTMVFQLIVASCFMKDSRCHVGNIEVGDNWLEYVDVSVAGMPLRRVGEQESLQEKLKNRRGV